MRVSSFFGHLEELVGWRQEAGGRGSSGARADRRNALRLAREAEETARGTVAKLADQSGELLHSMSGLGLTRRTHRQLGTIPRHGQSQQSASRGQDC